MKYSLFLHYSENQFDLLTQKLRVNLQMEQIINGNERQRGNLGMSHQEDENKDD